MPAPITVGLLTHAGGPHVGAYLSGLKSAKDCAAIVLADPDGRWEAEARRVLGDKLRAVYRDPRELLTRERPGMALVTMEAKLAPPVIDAALEAGCHVFAEKPACVRLADFEPLVRKADSKHRHVILALANRLNPAFVFARELVASGRLGKIYGLDMHLIADQTRLRGKTYHQGWFARKDRAGGGHLIWLGIHWLDLAMQLTGSDITRVVGMIHNTGGQPIDVEDSAVATLQFSGGFLGSMTSGYYLNTGYHSQIKVWGEKGWLRLQQMKDEPLHWMEYQGPQAGKLQPYAGVKTRGGYTPFVEAAVTACAHDTEPPISTAHGLRVLKTVFAIYESAEAGRAVTIG